ncbi:TonB-dependent receptor [Rhizosphaericola mali]|uniref:TonB-dependent receptor n=1 Tax=Rhizosphaericola mali TaxID=2545455 RepID=A0A5P2GAE6_9BACT|nr:TonB-dependent receptor [Rhizosphaericola mali]
MLRNVINTRSIFPNQYAHCKKLTFIYRQVVFVFALICLSTHLSAQNNIATVEGRIIDKSGNPIPHATISRSGNHGSTEANDSGYFKLEIPSGIMITLSYDALNYRKERHNYLLNRGQTRAVVISLNSQVKRLRDVKVTDKKNGRDAAIITLDPNKAKFNPSPIGGVEGLIKTIVGSNNEMTSQYNVRGGNYDENLIYVNGFEIYKPFLVQNAQSEGLSFINADMVENIKFSNGGFQAKYGDKMSSVLDVTYKKPTENGGSAYVGLLEQGLHLEGISKNKKFTYLIGGRNRTNQNLVKSQATQGSYLPSSSDIQGYFTYDAGKNWQIDLLGNYSKTKFTFYPQSLQLATAVISPLYTSEINANFAFEGSEKDKYSTNFVGLTASKKVNNHLNLKWSLSHYGDRETQNSDITSVYSLSSSDNAYNQDAADVIGSGTNINYSRNNLKIDVWTAQHNGSYKKGNHYWQWGALIERQKVNSYLNQWTYLDSAGYSLPNNTSGNFQLNDAMYGDQSFVLTRTSGFIQDNIQWGDSSSFLIQPGVRYNYNDLNKQFLISPRVTFSYQPKNWKRDVNFHGSVGMYNQPPFYREMLRYDGSLNKNLKAQKSIQGTLGMDYQFHMMSRPAKWTTEAYYKSMTDVDIYDIDNVRIRYYGNNNAKAYAYGLETRLFGELVKDAESWISIGYMRTMEKINGLTNTTYQNAEGQTINSQTQDKQITDSTVSNAGWFRRPTDRRITLGMFFQDYLTTNKNAKVYLNTIYGSNLPYNVPGSTKYRNSLEIDPYFRVDIGFSTLLVDGSKPHKSHSPFRTFKHIWGTVEVFNLIDRSNTISYTLIKDYSNNLYPLPNRLTPRLLNFKIIAEW